MGPPDTPSFTRRGRASGFTVLELALVLVMVGVLAVFAAPRLFTAQSITLPAVAAQVAASIRYTQSLAMSRGQRYRINFAAGTYQITDMGGAPIVQPLTASTAAVSVAPATLTGFNPPLTGGYVAFDGKGQPYVSATTPLAGTATITLTAGTEVATVRILPETGHVR
jgi:MSHA pilin protein MshC